MRLLRMGMTTIFMLFASILLADPAQVIIIRHAEKPTDLQTDI